MKTAVIIGTGTMGSAIAESLKSTYAVTGLDRGDDLSKAAAADIIIIAVKPQSFPALSRDLKQYIASQTVLSIMAGVRCEQISKQLDTKLVVRSMPNIALAKTKSVTGAYSLDQNQPHALGELLELWGKVVWLEKETDFDVFTALAGSGPAYFFEMTRQLQEVAEKLGFERKQAKDIVNSTLLSAAAVIDDRPASEMVAAVASEGGTTEAALSVFAKGSFDRIMSEAVAAAVVRSKELSR